MEFNEEQYKKFIFSKVEKKTNCPLEELVKGLSQFDQSISKYLNIGNQQKISYHMINIFGSFLKEKPKKVMHQDWFLHKFGYKYCAGLKKPIISEKFSVSKVNWDKLDNYSREHKALTRDANYQTEYNKIYVQNNFVINSFFCTH